VGTCARSGRDQSLFQSRERSSTAAEDKQVMAMAAFT
jgi:hypothetical protein